MELTQTRKKTLDDLFTTRSGLPNDLVNAFMHVNPEYGLTPVEPVPKFAEYLEEAPLNDAERDYVLQQSDKGSIQTYDTFVEFFNKRLGDINNNPGSKTQAYCWGRFNQILYGNDAVKNR